MEMVIRFPGKKKVSAEFDGFTVLTDQPTEAGGDGSAPAPFDLFFASLGTCAGIFVLSFCQKRGIDRRPRDPPDADGTRPSIWSPRSFSRSPPGGFPEKYRDSLIRSVELCTVKRHLQTPPRFEVLLRRARWAPVRALNPLAASRIQKEEETA